MAPASLSSVPSLDLARAGEASESVGLEGKGTCLFVGVGCLEPRCW
jgi:hypothetical protein